MAILKFIFKLFLICFSFLSSNINHMVEESTIVEEITTEPMTEEETISVIIEEITIEDEKAEASTQAEPVWSNITLKGDPTLTFDSLEDARNSIQLKLLPNIKDVAIENSRKYENEISILIQLVNNYRAENSLNTLNETSQLNIIACHRAAESAYANWNMVGYLDGVKHHLRPNLERASTIFSEYNLTGNFGENYARFSNTPEETLEAWKKSSAHNKLLLDSNYSTIGAGMAYDSEGYLYWILIFN